MKEFVCMNIKIDEENNTKPRLILEPVLSQTFQIS